MSEEVEQMLHVWRVVGERIAELEHERDALQEVLEETHVEFARHMEDWNAMKAERDALQAECQRLKGARSEP